MKKFLLFLSLGLLSYLIALLLQTPLTAVLGYFPHPDLSFKGADGRIWHGTVYHVQYRNFPPVQQLEWQFLPARLLQGRLALQLKTQLLDGMANGECGITWNQHWYCHDLGLQFPAAIVKQFPNPMLAQLPTLAGQLEGSFNQIDWQAQQLPTVDGVLYWQQPALQAPNALALGDQYSVQLKTDNTQTLQAEFSSLNTQFDINGSNANLAQDGKYEADVRVLPNANTNSSTQQGLAMLLGQAESNGTYHQKLTGQLSLPSWLTTP